MEGADSEFVNFILPTLKAFWQQAITCCSCYKMPQNTFFPRNHDLPVSKKHDTDTFFYPTSPFPGNFCKVVAFVLLHNSRFNFHCYTQREVTPTQKSARKCAATSRDFLRERLQSAFTLTNQLSLNRPIPWAQKQVEAPAKQNHFRW